MSCFYLFVCLLVFFQGFYGNSFCSLYNHNISYIYFKGVVFRRVIVGLLPFVAFVFVMNIIT